MGTYGIYAYEDQQQEKTNSSYGTLSSNFTFGLGYAGEKYKSGISVTADTTTLRAPNYAFVKPSAQRALIYFRVQF
ncbi:MAG: hypothetical protein H7061_01850 [Bdellovibrionaceae bacterium]|nr:hypothetical protein [Bdellovibrio sp.]